jgi:ABC-type bacteriocin/lantibiotic exporter with double-glycine peptidase domain
MVSYVPQDSFIVQGSIEENVALGREHSEIDIDTVIRILERVGLIDLVEKDIKGTKFDVGELGSKLSGGQRQRLGIARALYTNPKLLILDEATSALDTSSEKKIVDCLSSIKGEVTIISIAHRLSTVVNADRVIYVENGKIIAMGSFQEVRNLVPNFDSQARLSRL